MARATPACRNCALSYKSAASRIDPRADDKSGHNVVSSEEVMPRLAGKAAIVTGGAKGIGWHYSQALAAEGARVMIADIADGSELAEEIAARHGANSVASVKFDVSDEKQVQRLVSQTIDRFGQIDILVNNAALYAKLKPRNFVEWDNETWDRV